MFRICKPVPNTPKIAGYVSLFLTMKTPLAWMRTTPPKMGMEIVPVFDPSWGYLPSPRATLRAGVPNEEKRAHHSLITMVRKGFYRIVHRTYPDLRGRWSGFYRIRSDRNSEGIRAVWNAENWNGIHTSRSGAIRIKIVRFGSVWKEFVRYRLDKNRAERILSESCGSERFGRGVGGQRNGVERNGSVALTLATPFHTRVSHA